MSRKTDLSRTFDVVIAGAGPAGCVLARRLSEDRSKHILLIEAGPDPVAPGAEHPDVLNPFCLTASANAAFHWPGLLAVMALSQTSATMTARPYVQGYGIGGASNINGMGADRGLPGDYDGWRDLGLQDWCWDRVLPYFRKLERDLDFPAASSMHGDQGPMPVRRLPKSRWAPFSAAIGEALQERGFPFIEDYMSDFRDGFSSVPTNCLPDRRVSAATAYLTGEVRDRPNLTIIPHTRAERLKLEGRRACGIHVIESGTPIVVRGRQIILCCGAIQSPTVLMRSGVGLGEHLLKHGIEVACDLPGVGANLQNHPSIALTTYLSREATQTADNPSFLQNWLRYSSNHPRCEPSDMHLMAFNRCAWHVLGRRIGALAISVLKPYSKGRVELSSSSTSAPPRVHLNLLADSRDRERLVGGLRFALELLASPAVASIRRELFVPDERLVASLNPRHAWNAFRARAIASILDRTLLRRRLLARHPLGSDAHQEDERRLDEFVQAHVQPQFHVCGTCRMGLAEDEEAVVDSTGRVHGMQALRVVDASIFPTIPRGYTHFVVLMAAEKIADAIKSQWADKNPGVPAGNEVAACSMSVV